MLSVKDCQNKLNFSLKYTNINFYANFTYQQSLNVFLDMISNLSSVNLLLAIAIKLLMEKANVGASSFFSESERVVSKVIVLIEQSLWQRVAEKNVIRMAPLNIQHQTNNTLQSFGMIAESDGNAGKKKFRSIKKQYDPTPAKGDKLKPGMIRIQTKLRTLQDSSDVPDGINNISSNSNFFRKGVQKSKLMSSVLRSNTQNSINSVSKKVNGTKCRPLMTQFYQQLPTQQYKLWKRYVELQKAKRDQQIAEKQRLKQLEEKNIKNLKQFKEFKKVTFDYEGKFFGIENNINGKSKILNLKTKFITDSIAKKQKKIQFQRQDNPFTPRIIANSRLKQRQNRMAMQKNTYQESLKMYQKLKTSAGIANIFANEQQISQGVTIKENQTIKSRPWKGSDSSISRNMKLSEFRCMTKGRHFKEYSAIRAKTLQTLQYSQGMHVQSNTISPQNQQNNVWKNSKQNRHQSLASNKLRSEPRLPGPTQNQVRFKSATNIEIQRVPRDSRDDSLFNNSDQKRKIMFKTNSILNSEPSLISFTKGKRQIGSISVQNEQLYSSIVDDHLPIY